MAIFVGQSKFDPYGDGGGYKDFYDSVYEIKAGDYFASTFYISYFSTYGLSIGFLSSS